MKDFNGKILFLDRNDINTDEIIPAKYLTEITKDALKPYLLEDLNMEGFDSESDLPGKKVIVTRENFGCGSSREHAPWALEVNDINIVIAENFARIFRQNMFNCGMMAVPLEKNQIEKLFSTFSGKETELKTDFAGSKFTFTTGTESLEVPFEISDFDRSLVEAGGWVDFADKNY
ncbi:3-isopropylmalate dehydratase small subunit [Spirochaeta isovalerica]|uniref:3-isopropylmalate/(R)-2-methylmalate dehydratase small subunit n=1 Tax=Spirochaeta isovalerica TaxID=150 RepID=A0A841R444_9SPIO|nr:3-isopropylmalate dehydratase small subunit [Spirochaeta isovalerica]MBB6478573.1 3-isopropylmalate/(R)-2-methylmalate dehydratase small subunit [Spirochaeta isovalerica]